jgi:tetratricopeptide (TPR) repeat protein
MRQRLIYASLCTALLPVASVAWAQTQASAAPGSSAAPAASPASVPAAATRTDPKGKTGISPYMLKIVKANAMHVARDYAGAVAAYKEAIASDPNAPLGYYLLGESQLSAGNMAEAESSWKTGLVKSEGSDGIKVKLLFVLADLRERQGKWDDAKSAWDEYAKFVQAHPAAGGYAATATDRGKVIDQHLELAKKSDTVKQRIEQRLKEAAK